MQQYRLIKLEQGYIIISNEEITLSDTLNTCYYLFNNETFKREYSHHKEGKKIIASTFIPELPNIDFNGLKEEFGIIDVGNLELQYYKELEERKEIAKNFKGQVAGRHEDMFEHKEMHHMVRGYLEGFNKCLELNKDKLYTKEDILKVIEMSRILTDDKVEFETQDILGSSDNTYGIKIKYTENEILETLQLKTEWDIKIETEWIQDFAKGKIGGAGTIDIEIPKIINNLIKILKNE